MASPVKHLVTEEVDLDEVSPEVKSYIYQSLMEFEPFSTPTTTVAVVAKNPLKTDQNEASRFNHLDRKKLASMFRISIALIDNGTKIEAEALAEDIYDSIRLAKEKLIKRLTEIQDKIISNSDRQVQIRSAIAGGSDIH